MNRTQRPRVRRTIVALATLVVLGCGLVESAFAIQGMPSTITYIDDDGNRRIYCFARGNNQHLVVNYWDGSSWQWSDLGLPSGVTSVSRPSAITYIDSQGNRRIYVFAIANTTNLVVKYWNGFNWNWANQGGSLFNVDLTAITYIDPAGYRRIYVFGIHDITEHLMVNYWNGFTWQWSDRGLPANGKVTTVEAITHLDDVGNRRIYVFCRGGVATNFPLYVHYWDGDSWQWANHGGSAVGGVSTISYVDSAGHRRIYAFTRRDNSLFVNYWDGFTWQWADLGSPAPSDIMYSFSAITYVDSDGDRRISVFGQIGGRLYVKYWTGSNWYWADQGLPPGVDGLYSPNAITYTDRFGNRRIYVFCSGWNNNLVVNYWNGFSWQWADQGSL